jgi:peptidoglycan/LPS O-acetylase OafA/YrhL
MTEIPLLENHEIYQPVAEESKTESRIPPTYVGKFQAFLFILLPTWIQCYFLSRKLHVPSRPLSSTAWLDGLRGVAALIVAVYHFLEASPGFYNNPFYIGPYTEKDKGAIAWTSPLQLHIVRVIYAGTTMVPIFFLISGYVLSFKKVCLIRSQSFEKLLDTLFSSTVRRPFRLFPPVIVTLGIMLAQNHWKQHMGVATPTISAWLKQWYERSMIALATVFKVDHRDMRILHFWTIPNELTDSMILFTVAIGVSRMDTPRRVCSVSILAFFALYNGYWGVFLFLCGWVIAECEAILQLGDDKSRPIWYYGFWITSLIVGLLLGGYPTQNVDRDALLHRLPSHTPRVYVERGYMGVQYFWISLAAPLIVWPIFRLRGLQRIFTTSAAIYLGKISYALYAIHFQFYRVFSSRVHGISDLLIGTPRDSHISRHFAFALETAVYLFIVLWQADLFWRFVDMPTVRFARYIEKKVRSS